MEEGQEGEGTPDIEWDAIHVFPLFGREHTMTTKCWCHPVQDTEQPLVWIHNVVN